MLVCRAVGPVAVWLPTAPQSTRLLLVHPLQLASGCAVQLVANPLHHVPIPLPSGCCSGNVNTPPMVVVPTGVPSRQYVVAGCSTQSMGADPGPSGARAPGENNKALKLPARPRVVASPMHTTSAPVGPPKSPGTRPVVTNRDRAPTHGPELPLVPLDAAALEDTTAALLLLPAVELDNTGADELPALEDTAGIPEDPPVLLAGLLVAPALEDSVATEELPAPLVLVVAPTLDPAVLVAPALLVPGPLDPTLLPAVLLPLPPLLNVLPPLPLAPPEPEPLPPAPLLAPVAVEDPTPTIPLEPPTAAPGRHAPPSQCWDSWQSRSRLHATAQPPWISTSPPLHRGPHPSTNMATPKATPSPTTRALLPMPVTLPRQPRPARRK